MNISTSYKPVGIALLFIIALLTTFTAPAIAQPVDLGAGPVLAPTGTIPVNVPVQIRLVVNNVGDNPVPTHQCLVSVVNLGNGQTVFNGTVQGTPNFPVGGSETLTVVQQWTPNAQGNYQVRFQIAVQNDPVPTNNNGTGNVTVGPGLLTLAQATQILDAQVIAGHPRRDSLVAWHTRPPADPLDSLIRPGVSIQPVDSAFTLQYDEPVYLFFVDYHPELLYSHACEFVTVSAIDGGLVRRTAEIWPVVDGDDAVFGPSCGPNPNRVRGGAATCVEKQNPYVPVNTANTNAWAVVVVGKLNNDLEKTTVDHDICRYKERINGNPAGPKVSAPNIAVSAGADKCGLTKQQFCDAIDALKGKGCTKVFFKYIGHGTESGLVLWDERHKSSVILSYKDIACKLKEAGITNVCIEITACHSGGIIPQLEKKGIKGVVITSSSVSRPTPVGDGSGTWWEKALEECSRDPQANVNRDSTTDLCELFAWVKARGGANANNPNPQISKLTDSLKFVGGTMERVGTGKSVSTNTGSISVYAERFCVKTRYRNARGQWRDTTAYRGAVYMENTSNQDRASGKKYKVIAKCKSGDKTLVEEIVPSVPANGKICIADLPNDCTGIELKEIKKKGRAKRDDQPSPQAAGEVTTESFTGTSVHDDSTQFALYRHVIAAAGTERQYTASVVGPPNWFVATEPRSFTQPANTDVDVFTEAVPPAGSVFGGEITTTVSSGSDTMLLRYRMLLLDTLRGPVLPDSLVYRYNWILTEAPLVIPAATKLIMEESTLEIPVSLLMLSRSASLTRSTIAVDSGVYAELELGAGSHNYRDVIVAGLPQGILIKGGTGSLDGLVAGDSHSDGFSFEGNGFRRYAMRFLDVIGAYRFGATIFDGGADTANLYGFRVLLADSLDFVVGNGSRVGCTDCEYSETRTAVDATSWLGRYATISVSVRDTAGDPVGGVAITMVDSLGRNLYSGVTGADGLVPNQRVMMSERTGNSYTTYWPITVTARKGTEEKTVQHRGLTYTQLHFELNAAGASADRTAGSEAFAITGILPQPATGGLLRVHTNAGGSAIGVQVIDMLGRTVQSERTAANDGWLRLDISQARLVPGVYVLRLEHRAGHIATRTFVVE